MIWPIFIGIVPFAILFCILHVWAFSDHDKHRIDWPKVYEMELEVWGQTFEHMGAPPYEERRFPIANIETLAAAQLAMGQRTINEQRQYNPFENPAKPFESRAVRRLHDMQAMLKEMPCLCDDDKCFNLFGTLVNCPVHDPTPIETVR